MNDVFDETGLDKFLLEALPSVTYDNIEYPNPKVSLLDIAPEHMQVLGLGPHIGNEQGILPLGDPTEPPHKPHQIHLPPHLPPAHPPHKHPHETIGRLRHPILRELPQQLMLQHILNNLIFIPQLFRLFHVGDSQVHLWLLDVAVVAVELEELLEEVGEEVRVEEEIPTALEELLVEEEDAHD